LLADGTTGEHPTLNVKTIPHAAATHGGLKRDHNEDCFEASPELGLWLVADGVGGHSYGEIASDIVRSTVSKRIAAGDTLADAILGSHASILERIEEDEATKGMGSTVVALRLEGADYEVCWVGDSRAYLWHPKLAQLSEDHNRASELVASNVITPEQAASHPQRNVLTQSLGVSENMTLSPGHVTGTLTEGEQILLCSDGLTDELSDSSISKIMNEQTSPSAQVAALVKAALAAGGRDNITAVVVGECAPTLSSRGGGDLETTRETHRTLPMEEAPEGKLPLLAVLAVSAFALLTLWILSR
jgi:serine/threonine protein phosphatase PrpC